MKERGKKPQKPKKKPSTFQRTANKLNVEKQHEKKEEVNRITKLETRDLSKNDNKEKEKPHRLQDEVFHIRVNIEK